MKFPPKLIFDIPGTDEYKDDLETQLKECLSKFLNLPRIVFYVKLAELTNRENGYDPDTKCAYAEICRQINNETHILMLVSDDEKSYKYTLPGGKYNGDIKNFYEKLTEQLSRHPNFGDHPEFYINRECVHYLVKAQYFLTCSKLKFLDSSGYIMYEKRSFESTVVQFKWVKLQYFQEETEDGASFVVLKDGHSQDDSPLHVGGEGEEGEELKLDRNALLYLGQDDSCDGGDCLPCDDKEIDYSRIPEDNTNYDEEIKTQGGAQERDGFLGLIAGLGVTTACAFLLSLVR